MKTLIKQLEISKRYSMKVNALLFIWILVITSVSCGDSNRDYGSELYTKNCANCHGVEGQGLQDLYPPLKGADYLIEQQQDLVCLIRYGVEGEIKVNGKSYNQKMPSMPNLSDVDITNIINYISKNIEPGVKKVSLKDLKERSYDCK